MKLFSYVVTHDTGFSPNPFWGCCTLANCKPAIRRAAQVGDWIVGLSPKASGNRVVFGMKVDEIIDYASYFRDQRFSDKIPDYTRGEVVWKAGDNIYKPLQDGDFEAMIPITSFTLRSLNYESMTWLQAFQEQASSRVSHQAIS
ncbi:hypothetical protein RM530_12350 [Algiphilus sp. W345]|uniref:Nucleotide modification associated domain-containing protein n=1 Tax=Banduia mediterranea TaxID=3075609 RepID=A0ABU2WJU7_9GAMM|nr:hypothetical protein [Algiphilus sp. W345]MDT0498150.1 hypothetical protein [Algiphilus sp. W345]